MGRVVASVEGLELIVLARDVATRAHEGQVDKGGEPYIGHCARVAGALSGFEPALVAVGWLHDVVEDTALSEDDLLQMGFPIGVVHAVSAITRRADEPLEDYYWRVKSNKIAATVKRADLADNSAADRLARISDRETRDRLTEKYRYARGFFGEYSTSTLVGIVPADIGIGPIAWLSQADNQPIALYHSFPQADVDEALRRILAALAVEQDITRLVTVGSGGSAVGLEHRVKSPISTCNKIATLMQGQKYTRAGAPIYDLLRYTLVAPDIGQFVELIRNVERRLTRGDWGCRSFISFYVEGAPYKSVHAILDPPTDLTYLAVEIQFHTSQSWTLKQATHHLYEQQKELAQTSTKRVPDRLARLQAIFDRRQSAWETIPYVEGLDGLTWSGRPIEVRSVPRPASGSQLAAPHDR